ncbi:uncharacterized protein LOC128352893 [Hemicordylus capensis]|uniref:uncharacterized protein LOC128352893 n=1 Tax=Hemicordylus capensis TaxID=884348 RepID=UPI00230379DD|nr:uncharacterized protein LOC128352893 [Hemicordylus capensis]
MLYTAKLSHLKHPCDQQLKLSKNYIFDLAERTIRELISVLQKDAGTKKQHESHGLFPQQLHKLLSLLSSPEIIDLQEGKLSFLIEALIFHCILLADSSRTTVKRKLIKLCYGLLKLRKMITMDVSTMEGFPMENQLEESIQEKCCAMRNELENLNQTVHSAILYQIMDCFAETKGPLERLVEAAMEQCSLARKGSFLRELQPLITVFFNHSSQMLKVANFVLATCTEIETIQDIEECVGHLSRLLATVPTLLSEMSCFPSNNDVPEKLYFLCQIWSSTTESLLICLDKVIDLREFLDLIVQEMVGHKERSEKALDNQHTEEFSCHASSLSHQATQVVEFTSRHVDRARDPIFRNGLLVLVKQLEYAIRLLKIAIDQSMATITSLQAKEIYSKRAKDLIECTCNVRMGLDVCNQPDILSPLREGVRNFSIAEGFPSCSTPQDPPDLRGQNTRSQNTIDHSELLEEVSDSPLPVNCSSLKIPRGSVLLSNDTSGRADLHPLIDELITATKTKNKARLNGACVDLWELSNCCVDAAKEALQIDKSPELEKLLHYREMVELTPCLISLAREEAPDPISSTERLLQMATLLSESIFETKQHLTVVAYPWYSLTKQLFCIASPCDFPDHTHMLDNIMQTFVSLVQLAGKACLPDGDKELPEFPGLHETFLRVQAKLTCAQARTKQLLEKVLSVNNVHSGKAKLENIDGNCILWSVTIHAFLNSVDQFIGSNIVPLRELKIKIKHQLCLQSALAALSESSLRIQEAARLSLLLCAEQGAKNEIIALREEMKILTEALLEVAGALSASPLPAPNLSVHFELLQREFAVTAKVLLLRLGVVNREYLDTIQYVIRLNQPMACDKERDSDVMDKEAFEKNSGQLMANVRRVKKIIGDAFENLSDFMLKESLLSTVDHLLLLTDEVMGKAGKLQSQLDKKHLLEDSILYEWSAKAGYLVTQLQTAKGISESSLELIRRCLQNNEGHSHSSQPFHKTQSSPHKETEGIKDQDPSNSKDQDPPTPRHKATKSGQEPLCARDINKKHWGDLQSDCQSSCSEHSSRANPAALPRDPEKWWHDGCPVSQATREMATQMSYMAQFLKRKGPIATKEQLIACAAQIISGGQALVKFAGIIAKNCLDERCAAELLYAMEQTKTISYQLSIISRVNASTGRSRSSAEHLVSNAQNLTQAAFYMLKAAEAACVKGLRQTPPNSEEADVAAFCSQWRKCLWWHRAKEALNSERDELGLRKTGAWTEPTLMSMIQELSAKQS